MVWVLVGTATEPVLMSLDDIERSWHPCFEWRGRIRK